MNSTTDPQPGRALSLGIFLIASAAIVFEITLTKIFSVTLWYHFAYFVVSIAMFGLGAGGLLVYFLRERVRNRSSDLLPVCGLAQFFSTLICQLYVSNVDMSLSFHLSSILEMVNLYILCSLPFVAAGAGLSLCFSAYWNDVPRLYAADLAGSAVGCVFFLYLIDRIDGPEVSLVSALTALAGAAAWTIHAGPSARLRPRLAGVAALGLLSIGIGCFSPALDLKYTKSYRGNNDVIFEKWSALSRITLYSRVFWNSEKENPFGWGMSSKWVPHEGPRQLWIEQDSSAGTPITEFDGDFSRLAHLRYDITSLPYHLLPSPERTFIVGAGGGRDVLTALSFGAHRVRACDINPVTIELVRDHYNDFAGGLYRDPRVEVVVDEARSHLRSGSDRFDVIQISLIDSWAATVAGAFSLAENNLYTREAFVDYLEHLTDEGVLSVSRFLFRPRTQTLRLAVLARSALEAFGAEDPAAHMALLGTGDTGTSTLLVSRTPFSPERIARLRELAAEFEYTVLHLPGGPSEPEFAAALSPSGIDEFIRTAYYDFRAPTDDRPFFFQMLYMSRAFDLFSPDRHEDGQEFNYYGQVVILELLGISAVMVVLFFIVPLLLSRRVQPLPVRWGLYYVLLGAGFMLVEIPLLQKGGLYLGHPTYSLSIVLFSMLLFTGLGSRLSDGIAADRLPLRLPWLLGVVASGAFVAAFTLDVLIPATIGLGFAARAAIMTLICAVLATFMGTAFPSGLRILGGSGDGAIPWVWALNGGASVMGSIFAMAVSMSFGYRVTLLAGGAAYVCAALLVATRKRA